MARGDDDDVDGDCDDDGEDNDDNDNDDGDEEHNNDESDEEPVHPAAGTYKTNPWIKKGGCQRTGQHLHYHQIDSLQFFIFDQSRAYHDMPTNQPTP